ncbi:enoyl-CoA hydratase/carnithine racemase [Novosphingobium hassiacum]|uniref:Enoyl-CoA hydratase/carnithine racemase n=1 Tax=Novosphingobium hassiacum TaxID=173676 RepID=A0A7W6A0C9_9SPHN|nr:enoyl-CoA hydratase/isomerase family protein [Novosphingobium hassiacum]MBB3860940.1 enoyl-CoA hydratase/carnithine racemase [Novosphingobium hassiacum]
MKTQFIHHEENDRVTTLTLARPELLNAISPPLMTELLAAVASVAASEARVLILTGQGKAFSAGVDLKYAQSPEFSPAVQSQFSQEARELCKMLETMPQAVIARVDGFCLTGGLEIALACDLIVASERSRFADTHARIGLYPGWGGSQRLPARVGAMRAREMSFTGRHYTAAEAATIGLILEAVPDDQLDGRIQEICRSVLSNKSRSIAQYKSLYRASENLGLDEGLAYEAAIPFPARRRPAPEAG